MGHNRALLILIIHENITGDSKNVKTRTSTITDERECHRKKRTINEKKKSTKHLSLPTTWW